MPRNVRNFWVDLSVDGRSNVGTGPVARDGGFEQTILMRDRGGIVEGCRISGRAIGGRLILAVTFPDGRELRVETER